ncbi:hypothetical protein Q9L58_010568 [Maublancomyces gigas]|uniref:Uncharacterized protein n=1 Tax=Discina gigas TaxID=1032678 RepID=A0ABR3G3S5_9PEZI
MLATNPPHYDRMPTRTSKLPTRRVHRFTTKLLRYATPMRTQTGAHPQWSYLNLPSSEFHIAHTELGQFPTPSVVVLSHDHFRAALLHCVITPTAEASTSTKNGTSTSTPTSSMHAA